MRILALLVVLLVGCSPATRSGGPGPPTYAYSVAIVSGDHQVGTAVVQPVTVSIAPVGSPAPSLPPPLVGTFLPLALVVEVRDRSGSLVDGVDVVFTDPTPGTGVNGLGTQTSGQPSSWPTGSFPATRGRAGIPAEPYRIGTFPVDCRVDPSAGSSNVVRFTVTGT